MLTKAKEEAALAAAIEWITRHLRGTTFVYFHRNALRWWVEYEKLREQVGFSDDTSAEKLFNLMRDAASYVEKTISGIHVWVESDSYCRVREIKIALKASAEWSEVLLAVHNGVASALTRMSHAAECFLELLKKNKYANFTPEMSIRRELGFYGYNRFSQLITEIRVQRGLLVTEESEGDSYRKTKRRLRFTLSKAPEVDPTPTWNPVLDFDIRSPATRRLFRRPFFGLLRGSNYTGKEAQIIWKFRSRGEFLRCFPSLGSEKEFSSSFLISLLSTLRESEHFGIGWDLSDSPVWTVTVRPKADWIVLRQSLVAELAKETTESALGLTSEAAALYDWLKTFKPADLQFGLTPCVKNAIEKNELMIDNTFSRDNLPVFIELLCDEISEITPLFARAFPWKESYQDQLRIRLREKRVVPAPLTPVSA